MKNQFMLLILISAISCSNVNTRSNKNTPIKGSETFLIHDITSGHPDAKYCEQVMEYSGFHLCYNEAHEQAAWVAYILTKEMIQNSHVGRTDDYRPDKNIKTGSAGLDDYRRSGYTRGHLAPAGAMKWSETAMSESFMLSNMSPQLYEFNSGIWEKLERKVRHWAHQEEAIYIVTGPVLTPSLQKIGQNGVSVPEYYYKVILDIQPPEYKGIGFIMKHAGSDENIYAFALSIDSVEDITGIDFFPGLDEPLEEKLESYYNTVDWK